MKEIKPRNYKRNFLSKVVLRMDYDPIPSLKKGEKSLFSERITSKYPFVESKPITQISVKFSPTESGIEQQHSGQVWIHRNEEKGQRVVILAPDYFALEYGKQEYKHLTEFENDLSYAFTEFDKTCKVPEFSRIGLRYINEIVLKEGNPFDWNNIISKDLITSAMAGMAGGMKLTRSMHQFMSIYKEDINVLFQYGIFNPEFPNPVAIRQFILDIDCHIKGAIPNTEAVKRISDLNDIAIIMFEGSIEDGLRARMEVEE
jgi:uncharacterized protein (TIGR04255 family)